jgi:ribosomal protein S18 acetylase RimI-like enzyme
MTPPPSLSHRLATESDLPLLGELNQQLIEDEGHSNPMTPDELSERMRGWLNEGVYQIVLFGESEQADPSEGVVGYAVFKGEATEVYLRQLFVARDRRNRGFGAAMMMILEQDYFQEYQTVRLEVLTTNTAAHRFYTANGFSDYCITMKKPM